MRQTINKALTEIKIPQVKVPKFWLSNFWKVQDYLDHKIKYGQVHHYGRSAAGYPLRLVEYRNSEKLKLMVTGGVHGHEPGGVAAVMNMIHLLETGKDLAGKTNNHLLGLAKETHLFLVPVFNPDGRLVNLDSYYGMSTDTCGIYANGLKKNGELVPYNADASPPLYYINPKDCLFVGGQFNSAGYAINRVRNIEKSDCAETEALLDFVKKRKKIEAVLDFHACGYNELLQARSHEPPYWEIMRELQRRAEKIFKSKNRPLRSLYGDNKAPKGHFQNDAYFHRHAHLMWIYFEGREGYLGATCYMPLPSEYEIIDDYLTAMTLFFEMGKEGVYTETNRKVLGE